MAQGGSLALGEDCGLKKRETLMRILISILASAALLTAGSALAQQKPTPAPSPQASTDAAPTHEMCKAVMGSKMDAKQPHDHGRDKTGAPTFPNGKPLTKAEMEKMHKQCAAKLAGGK
jgi:hypothetical protein